MTSTNYIYKGEVGGEKNSTRLNTVEFKIWMPV